MGPRPTRRHPASFIVHDVIWMSGEKFFEGDTSLEARERRTEAVMGTEPKREMARTLLLDVKLVGGLEGALIVVGRAIANEQAAVCGDRYTV